MLQQDFFTLESKPLVLSYSARRDLPDILCVENQSFRLPWSEEQFLQCFQTAKTNGATARSGDVCCGFVIYELKKDFLIILNLAVLPDCRRMGVATRLVDRIKAYRPQIKAGISEWHVDGQLFLKSQGFHCTQSVETNHNRDVEMAYMFEWNKG